MRSKLGKGGRNRSKGTNKRQSSSLADHKRTGKVLSPPMMAIGGVTPVIWWKQNLPDYLWLCWQVSSGEYEEVYYASVILDRIAEGLGEDRTDYPQEWVLTGKLSDFEAIPEPARVRLMTFLDQELYSVVVPVEFANALAMYPDAPGRWLINRWLDQGMTIDPEAAERELGEVVKKSMDGRDDLATRAKALFFRQMLSSGRLMFSQDSMTKESQEAIKGYPLKNSQEQNAHAESNIRAMFLAIESNNNENNWNARFWRSNWRLYVCKASSVEPGPDVIDGQSDKSKASLDELQSAVEQRWDKFVYTAQTVDPDIYSPDRFEVLTGITGRCLRLVRTIAGYPRMWTMEQGAPVLRALVEARITIRYLLKKDDPELYQKFKSFGVGHLKLLKLHLENFIDAAGEAGPGLQEYLELVSAYVNRDTYEEYIEIDLSGSFSGTDMRRMSQDVGLEDDYRLIFAPASINVHGEWGGIDMNVFQPCLNPLHAYHRVVVDEDWTIIGPHFVNDLIRYADDLLTEYNSAVVST